MRYPTKYTSDYLWLDSYLDNDSLWLDDTVSWDSAFDLAASDYTTFSFLTNAFFLNLHLFLDATINLSFLDLFFSKDSSRLDRSKELFELLMWDLALFLDRNILPSQFFFYTDHQDFIVIILNHQPELSLAILSLKELYWYNFLINLIPSSFFDLFTDPLSSSLSEALDYFIVFIFFSWGVLFFMETLIRGIIYFYL